MQEQEQIRRGVPGRNSQKSVPWYSTLESHCVLTLLQNLAWRSGRAATFRCYFLLRFFWPGILVELYQCVFTFIFFIFSLAFWSRSIFGPSMCCRQRRAAESLSRAVARNSRSFRLLGVPVLSKETLAAGPRFGQREVLPAPASRSSSEMCDWL